MMTKKRHCFIYVRILGGVVSYCNSTNLENDFATVEDKGHRMSSWDGLKDENFSWFC